MNWIKFIAGLISYFSFPFFFLGLPILGFGIISPIFPDAPKDSFLIYTILGLMLTSPRLIFKKIYNSLEAKDMKSFEDFSNSLGNLDYFHYLQDTGISIAGDKIIVCNGIKVKSYTRDELRNWVVIPGVGASGLELTVADIEQPKWKITVANKNNMPDKWLEIINQWISK